MLSWQSSNSSCLSCCRSLCIRSQRLHLLMTLAKIKDFYACRRVDLMHGIARCSASLAIQVVALNEHRVIAEASQPDIAFSAEIELNAFAYMQTGRREKDAKRWANRSASTKMRILPSSFTLFCSMNIAQRTQAEPVASRWINVAVHRDVGLAWGNLECFADLGVQLEVGDRAPVLWCRLTRQSLLLVGHLGLNRGSHVVRLVDCPRVGWLHRLGVCQGVWATSRPVGSLSSTDALLLSERLRWLHVGAVDAWGISVLWHLYWWWSRIWCWSHLLGVGELSIGCGGEVILFLCLLIRLRILRAARLGHQRWRSHLLLLLLWCLRRRCWLLQEHTFRTAHRQNVCRRCWWINAQN